MHGSDKPVFALNAGIPYMGKEISAYFIAHNAKVIDYSALNLEGDQKCVVPVGRLQTMTWRLSKLDNC